jgi:hypothetical protein
VRVGECSSSASNPCTSAESGSSSASSRASVTSDGSKEVLGSATVAEATTLAFQAANP